MKRYMLLFILFITGCAAVERVSNVNIDKAFPHYEIQKIAVLMFETSFQDKEKPESGFSEFAESPNARTVLSDITARELVKWGRYVVLDRRALGEELKRMNLDQKAVLHGKDFSSFGKALGVDAVVIGTIEKFGISYRTLFSKMALSVTSRVSVLIKCVEVKNNEMIWSIKIDGASKKDNEKTLASELITKAIRELKEKFK